MDLAWANATFALIATSYDFHLGIGQTESPDYLFYQGQALRLVNGRLSASPTKIADSTLGAVATQCNLDIMTGNLSSAKAHMTGLEQMIMIKRRQMRENSKDSLGKL
jgi:hypothetical protein